MRNEDEYKTLLKNMFGKTIAIVYIFEGDDAPGCSHYESWKSDVISSWMFAIEEMQGLPLILDIRTFVQKAMNKSLPYIDFVINLNNGTKSISTLGLVPSVCSFLNIPCVPCNTVSIITGEHKRLSNIVAGHQGFQVPKSIDSTDPSGITRPIGLGSSLGVKRGITENSFHNNFMYQEFIQGTDMTTPILYNPMTEALEVLPTILYHQKNPDINWFLDENEKVLHKSYTKKLVRIEKAAQDICIQMADTMEINCYCRIDSRLSCSSSAELDDSISPQIPLSKIYFMEINPMPTIKNGINFHTAIDGLEKGDSLYTSYQIYKEAIKKHTPTGFILSCSMIALLKAMH